MNMIIDTIKPKDWELIRAIYLEGVDTGNATFETGAPNWEKWHNDHLPQCRLAARMAKTVLGWVALSPVSNRCVYAGIAEVSLYVGAAYQGLGVGSALLAALIDASEKQGIWSLQAGIFPENAASLGLFKKHGFRELGRKEKAGKMTFGLHAGKWRDVVLMERRSKVVGTD
jgi:L-amino acid N-acyltransferase YncA